MKAEGWGWRLEDLLEAVRMAYGEKRAELRQCHTDGWRRGCRVHLQRGQDSSVRAVLGLEVVPEKGPLGWCAGSGLRCRMDCAILLFTWTAEDEFSEKGTELSFRGGCVRGWQGAHGKVQGCRRKNRCWELQGMNVGEPRSEPGHCDIRLPSSAVASWRDSGQRGAESDNFDSEKDALGDYIMRLESMLNTTKIILLWLDQK